MPDPFKEPGPSPIPFAPPSAMPSPLNPVGVQSPPIQNSVPSRTLEQKPPKGKKNILILVFAVLIITVLIGVSFLFIFPKFKKTTTDTPITQPNTEKDTQSTKEADQQSTSEANLEISNPKFESIDFSILGPTGWTKITGSAGSLILFQKSQADKDANGQTFAASINVATDFLENGDMTLESYAKDINTQRQTTLVGYVLKSQSKGTLANQVANVDVYRAKIGNIDVQQGQIYILKNHKAYVITFNALVDSWDKYTKIFDETAKSFQLICNSGACLPVE